MASKYILFTEGFPKVQIKNTQIYRDGKDCGQLAVVAERSKKKTGQIGDKMSDNDEKLPYLH